LRLAMGRRLQIVRPVSSRARDVRSLCRLRPAEEQEDRRGATPPKIQPVPGPKRHPRLPYAAAQVLMIAEISHAEAKHPRLNARGNRYVQATQPIPIRIRAILRHVLADRQHHMTSLENDIIYDNLVKHR